MDSHHEEGTMGFHEYPGPVNVVVCSGRECKRSHLVLQMLEDLGVEPENILLDDFGG